nr:hypothetical protein CFP56_09192 [Quercus suber]
MARNSWRTSRSLVKVHALFSDLNRAAADDQKVHASPAGADGARNGRGPVMTCSHAVPVSQGTFDTADEVDPSTCSASLGKVDAAASMHVRQFESSEELVDLVTVRRRRTASVYSTANLDLNLIALFHESEAMNDQGKSCHHDKFDHVCVTWSESLQYRLSQHPKKSDGSRGMTTGVAIAEPAGRSMRLAFEHTGVISRLEMGPQSRPPAIVPSLRKKIE